MSDIPRSNEPAVTRRGRQIRSYVRREGRMTSAQQRNLDRLWSRYGLDCSRCDWPAVFGRDARRTLEIGFGAGEVLAALAAERPQEDFLGVEVYRSGTGRLLGELEHRNLDNVRLFCEDAVNVLNQAIPPASLDTVLLYFPD
ncbi:MAG: tRNA (guanosine(46)-N7)-methyltransferase TrmB, partial [Salinisphaera sp.]|nr:tRNA (guanosine(46)-N7)-methyltransferase TrmB [Salinisphaera sp.]